MFFYCHLGLLELLPQINGILYIPRALYLPICSMGLEYLPTFTIHFSHSCSSKYSSPIRRISWVENQVAEFVKTFLGPELASAYANDEPKDRDVGMRRLGCGWRTQKKSPLLTASFFGLKLGTYNIIKSYYFKNPHFFWGS